MASNDTLPQALHDPDVSLRDIIFSCGICQATPSEVYTIREHNQGFHNGSDDEDGVVTKFWIADCCHTFCSKHLEGGGLPFHSKASPPNATCPVCIKKGQSNQNRRLFYIRGLEAGEYDEQVPDAFLKFPPLRLDAENPETHAMRFQYTHLIDYAMEATKHWRSANKKRSIVETTHFAERKRWQQSEAELSDRIVNLEKSEARLQKWEARRDLINHYLGLVNQLSEDNQELRHQLNQLGYDVPPKSYSYKPGHQVLSQASQLPARSQFARAQSSATLVGDNNLSSSSRKRNHSECDRYEENEMNKENQPRPHQRGTRDPMPPPSIRPNQLEQSHIRPNSNIDEPERQPQPQRSSNSYMYRSAPTQAKSHMNVGNSLAGQSTRPHGNLATASRVPGDRAGPHRRSPSFEYQDSETMHSHRALPFRSQGVPEHDQRREPRYQPEDGYQTMPSRQVNMSVAPTQPSGLLSVPPRRRPQNQYETASENSRRESHQILTPRDLAPSRIAQVEPAFGSVAQHTENESSHNPGPLHPPRSMAPPSDSIQQRRGVQRQPLRPTTNSIYGGFFKEYSRLSEPESMRRPLSRRHDLEPQNIPGAFSSAYRRAPHRPADPLHIDGHGQHSLSESVGLLSSRPQQPAVTSTQRLGSSSIPSREAYVPQTPLDAPSKFQYQRQPLVARTSQPVPHLNRSRMTLPPSSRMSLLSNSGDPQLSMINGVREAGPLQNTRSRQGLASEYTPSRGLYSTPGGRRGVQR